MKIRSTEHARYLFAVRPILVNIFVCDQTTFVHNHCRITLCYYNELYVSRNDRHERGGSKAVRNNNDNRKRNEK